MLQLQAKIAPIGSSDEMISDYEETLSQELLLHKTIEDVELDLNRMNLTTS